MASVKFQLEACPHCHSDGAVKEHAVYRYQCAVCGNPRIPVDERWLTTPTTVTRDLKRVRRQHIQQGAWKAGSWLLWSIAFLCALFGAGAAWSLDYGTAGWTFISVLTLIPLVLGVFSRLTARSLEARTKSDLEEAWRKLAVHFFTAVPTGRTLDDVKAAFDVDTESALQLLAQGEVANYLDYGVQGTSNGSAPRERVRIADQPGGSDAEDLEEDALAGSNANDVLASFPERHK
jgi:hypothetical protein